MLLCMRSAKCLPRASALASMTLTPLLEVRPGPSLLHSPIFKSNSRGEVRWSTSHTQKTRFQENKSALGHGKKTNIDGWTTFSVLALMAASAAGAGLAVGWKAEGRKDREREYSNAGKFVSPAYASLSDMESVSF